MLVFGLLFIFVCGVAYVHILNNKSVQSGNPSNPYLVEDDGIYEDDTYQEYQEYEEEEEMDYDFQHQDYYEDDAYETDPYDDNSNMYDEDTYRSHFSEEERY